MGMTFLEKHYPPEQSAEASSLSISLISNSASLDEGGKGGKDSDKDGKGSGNGSSKGVEKGSKDSGKGESGGQGDSETGKTGGKSKAIADEGKRRSRNPRGNVEK